MLIMVPSLGFRSPISKSNQADNIKTVFGFTSVMQKHQEIDTIACKIFSKKKPPSTFRFTNILSNLIQY